MWSAAPLSVQEQPHLGDVPLFTTLDAQPPLDLLRTRVLALEGVVGSLEQRLAQVEATLATPWWGQRLWLWLTRLLRGRV